jgi:hypothetical protein
MPIEISATTGQTQPKPVFIGNRQTLTVKVDISTLTSNEVDAKGNLKAGTPLGRDGKRLTGVVGEAVFGAVPEHVKIVPANPTNASLAAVTDDVFVAVGVNGIFDRDAAEFNLGRVLTAAEIAGFESGKCKVVISRV